MGLDSREIQRLRMRKPASADRAIRQEVGRTSLLYFLVRHRALYILFVGKDE